MNSARHQAAGRSARKPAIVETPGADEEFRRSYPAAPETLRRVRNEFGALGMRHGASEEQVDDIRMVVSEAVTNAVRHAYPGGPGGKPGSVHAMAAVSDGRLTILVSDDGVGPRTQSADPGAGWGWPLLAALTERFTIRRRSNGGTEVELRMRIGPERRRASQGRRGSDSSASMPPAPPFSTTS